ncbi:hypothetical protein GOV12_00245 [Candidatus Pacearchaeota archaeon]|nr:hypothetical protein [Candidatus Pacearchaeota archaeon]
MKSKNLLIILISIAMIVLVVNMLVTYIKVNDFKKELTGWAFGSVNISINRSIEINVSRSLIDWGQGSINGSFSNATLFTDGDNPGNVSRGNWSGTNVFGLVIVNVGTDNCSLYIQAGKNAHDFFISSNSTNEEYKVKVSNMEANSCSGTGIIDLWVDSNKTSGGTKYCQNFGALGTNNSVYIDVLLTVPINSNKYGDQSDLLTITASPVLN